MRTVETKIVKVKRPDVNGAMIEVDVPYELYTCAEGHVNTHDGKSIQWWGIAIIGQRGGLHTGSEKYIRKLWKKLG